LKKDEEYIERIKNSLSNLAFADVKMASNGGAKMGAFILASCFIDYIAGFYYGHKADRSDYINFTNKYLKKYDGDKIYYSVRNGLVHNYFVERDYVFSDKGADGPNLGKYKNGKIVLNLEDFLSDIESAMNKYFKALDRDNELRKRAIKRFKRGKILEVLG
jgi:hypothetical protein